MQSLTTTAPRKQCPNNTSERRKKKLENNSPPRRICRGCPSRTPHAPSPPESHGPSSARTCETHTVEIGSGNKHTQSNMELALKESKMRNSNVVERIRNEESAT